MITHSFDFESIDAVNYEKDYSDNEIEQDLLETMLSLSKPLKDMNTDDQNINNLTSFTETDKGNNDNDIKIKTDYHLPDKSNDELNETSFTIKSNHTDEDDSITKIEKNQIFTYGELPLINPTNHYNYPLTNTNNKIFKIKKTKRKKNFRKNDPDTIRRKIKPHFHKYIIQLLNSKIKQLKIPKLKKRKFLKFNNYITSTVSIKLNKNLLNKTIKSILITEDISTKYKHFPKNNNASLITLISKANDPDIKKILEMTYGDMFNQFLKSKWYSDLLNKIKHKDGDNYVKKFDIIAQDLVPYFYLTDPKKEKNKNIIETTTTNTSMVCSNKQYNEDCNNGFAFYNYNMYDKYDTFNKFNYISDDSGYYKINNIKSTFNENNSTKMKIDGDVCYINFSDMND